MFLALVLPCVSTGQASREEVLRRVYPSATIQAQRHFLTEDQMKRAATLSGVDVPTALIAGYVATAGGKVVGRAYVDTHVVRTKNESLLICLDESGKLKRVEVTAFLEPPEYRGNDAWYGQFRDRTLTSDLNLNRAIRPIAGATLTGTATTRAVRRILAIDQVLR
jgi:electron transport complex protein RnfG